MSENLEKNFGIFNQLISNVDIYTFYSVIDHIISNIKLNQRNLIFECIDSLTKKFIKIFLGNNEENKLFLNQYFTIISSFLIGVNKLIPEKKEEIKLFNEYFLPVLNYIKNPKKFLLYEQLVSTMEEYIKCLQGINEESSLILKNIKLIVEKDETLSGVCFSYISTFLNYIQNNISSNPLNQLDLFTDILDIIKKGFSIKEETLKTSKINSLLLTLQILSLNPNLNIEIFEDLILKSLNSFELIETKEDRTRRFLPHPPKAGYLLRKDRQLLLQRKPHPLFGRCALRPFAPAQSGYAFRSPAFRCLPGGRGIYDFRG